MPFVQHKGVRKKSSSRSLTRWLRNRTTPQQLGEKSVTSPTALLVMTS
jgi:hypothetical protein